MAQYALVKCNINGKDVEKIVDVRASLTDMLRNDFRLTSVKKGCEVGECGACTALIDGEAINTCLYLAVWAEGKHIITLEGLMNPDGTHRALRSPAAEARAAPAEPQDRRPYPRVLSRGPSCSADGRA